MEKTAKYEFTGETDTVTDGNGVAHVVKRIRALRNIYTLVKGVQKNDLGGWIESESNLSQNGECWVNENACVLWKCCC